MKTTILSFVFGFVMALAVGACSPAQRETARDVRDVVQPLVEPACVILKRLAPSGITNQICATADDLLPFFDDILALREARQAGEGPSSVGVLAFTLAPPTKPVARRRCLAWEELRSTDGGLDGGR